MSNQIIVTPEQIELLHSGHVLKRWLSHGGYGRHVKMRVVKPVVYQSCDNCYEGIEGKAVKTECSGSITLLTQCPTCAVKELNEC